MKALHRSCAFTSRVVVVWYVDTSMFKGKAARRIVLLLLCAGLAGQSSAQTVPSALPSYLRNSQLTTLSLLREALLLQRETLLIQIRAHNAKCSQVEENSPLASECAASAAELNFAIASYKDKLSSYQSMLAQAMFDYEQWKQTCDQAAAHMRQVRAEIGKNQAQNRATREELDRWTALNKEAQKEAVMASLRFVLGQYASKLDQSMQSLQKLDAQILKLIATSRNTRKLANQQKLYQQIAGKIQALQPKLREAGARWGAQTLVDGDSLWNAANKTLQHEFRVASKHNQSIRELLQDPAFREAFAGDEVDKPSVDLLSALVEKAIEDSASVLKWIEEYEGQIGTATRAVVFVRDAAYAMTASYLSTERVLQQNEVATLVAKASAALQKEYKRSVDDYIHNECNAP